MKVGLVEEDHRPLGLVGHEVFHVFLAGHRTGGVIGIADVDEPGLGVSLGHGLDVVRIVLAERDLDRPGADEMGGPLAGLVAGVGDDEAPPGEVKARTARCSGSLEPANGRTFSTDSPSISASSLTKVKVCSYR